MHIHSQECIGGMMAHSFESIGGILFSYNSDGSGEVSIDTPQEHVYVPFDDLIEFIAHVIRNKKVSELEAMSSEEVLGL